MQFEQRSGVIAFLLSFLPGLGHLYMGRYVRALVYGCGFFGPIALILLMIISNSHEEEMAIICAITAAICGIVNMIDMLVFLLRRPAYSAFPAAAYQSQPEQAAWGQDPYVHAYQQYEKRKLILMSCIPGLGHYQLGLMQRGLTAMLSFFGAVVLIVFLTAVTSNGGFLAFIFILPVIFFYTMFDALKQLERKQAGYELIDRSLFDDLQQSDVYGRKNRTLATIIAIFPGAAHLYLSMPKRGLQLMAGFLFSIYVLDVLRLSLFFFLIPLLWFFSFFDALQQMNKYENNTLIDKPILENWTAYQRPIGFVLILIGCYYALKEGAVQILYRLFPDTNFGYWLSNFTQTAIVALLLIGGGIRLLMQQKSR